AVVGTGRATSTIRTGQLLRIDGSAGTVTILEAGRGGREPCQTLWRSRPKVPSEQGLYGAWHRKELRARSRRPPSGGCEVLRRQELGAGRADRGRDPGAAGVRRLDCCVPVLRGGSGARANARGGNVGPFAGRRRCGRGGVAPARRGDAVGADSPVG